MPRPRRPTPQPIQHEFEVNLLMERQALTALIGFCPEFAEQLEEFLERHGDDLDDDLCWTLADIAWILKRLPDRKVNYEGHGLRSLRRRLKRVEENIRVFQVGRPQKFGVPDEDIPTKS